MPIFTDQLNRTIELTAMPKRIVSLVPSQTELLYDLGLETEVVGITKFCVHPQQWFRTKARIGGTKNVNIEKIAELHPDLVIANKEENVQEQVEQLAERFNVWVSDVNTLPDAYEMITSLGEITGRDVQAKAMVENIQLQFSQLQTSNLELRSSQNKLQTTNDKPLTAYLIWKDPYMTVGGDTFIHHMLEAAGFQNVFIQKKRYPAVSIEGLQKTNCQCILLSSEPYPFQQKHVEELRSQFPNTQIILVDGEMFSWYGSRLLQAPAYFRKLQQQIGLMA